MTWFRGIGASRDQNSRLDAASRGLIAAQADLETEAAATAQSSKQSRRETMVERRKTQLATRALREHPLQTSVVRAAVEQALADMDQRANHRAQNKH